MRILYADLEAEWRGGQNQALLTLKGLRTRGHDVELLAVCRGFAADRARAEGIRVHEVARSVSRLHAALLLRRLLRERAFDVVHANEPHALTAAWLARTHRHVPLVVSRRVGFSLPRNPMALARYRAAARILAISQFVAERIRVAGLPAETIEVVHEGVELPARVTQEMRRDARHQWGANDDVPLLGCVGYLLPDKGQEFLIRALALLRRQGRSCRVLLAGDGPERARLERLASELGLESSVLFAGFVSQMPAVYAALDMFVFPSLFDALGTSLLAAMSYGLPCVALACGGVPEIIEEDRSGVLVTGAGPAHYPQAIAAALARLLDDPSFAAALGRGARERIRAEFSVDSMVENTLRVYQRLTDISGKSFKEAF